MEGTWTPLREALWWTPEAVQAASGWQHHTEHGRTAPGCAGTEGSPTTARLTSMTSCLFQNPQGAVLEGCDLPGGHQPAGAGWCGGQGCFSGRSPCASSPLYSEVPIGILM